MSNLPTGQAAHKTSGGGGALGGPIQAAPAHPLTVGSVGFGPMWEDQPSLRELYDQAVSGLVRAEREVEELRAEVALLREERRILTNRQSRPRTWGAEYTDTLNLLKQQRDQWRECAEELARIIDDLDAHDEPTCKRINESVDRFRRLKEASK